MKDKIEKIASMACIVFFFIGHYTNNVEMLITWGVFMLWLQQKINHRENQHGKY